MSPGRVSTADASWVICSQALQKGLKVGFIILHMQKHFHGCWAEAFRPLMDKFNQQPCAWSLLCPSSTR